MKKVFLVFLVVVLVLLTSNNLVLADADDIIATIKGVDYVRLLKTDSECRKIGGSLIPQNSRRQIIKVDIAEASFELPQGACYLFGKGEKFQILNHKGLKYLLLSQGFYALYTEP